MTESASLMKRLTGKHVLFSLLGFFALVIGMNAVMATIAIRSFDGRVEPNAYRDGLAFNKRIGAARQAAELGWDMTAAIAAERITLTLLGPGGIALSGADVEGMLWRPTAKGMDQRLAFHSIGNGVYEADMQSGLSGRWDLRLVVRRGDDQVTFRREVMLGSVGR